MGVDEFIVWERVNKEVLHAEYRAYIDATLRAVYGPGIESIKDYKTWATVKHDELLTQSKSDYWVKVFSLRVGLKRSNYGTVEEAGQAFAFFLSEFRDACLPYDAVEVHSSGIGTGKVAL